MLFAVARFSALQRAENSSIVRDVETEGYHAVFQCSSASRKFLNRSMCLTISVRCASFSALQRAENSSICFQLYEPTTRIEFQCSSASRKFLNPVRRKRRGNVASVSVLFSEPKIPQSPPRLAVLCNKRRFQCSSASRKFLNLTVVSDLHRAAKVSVLFSEPKIPQSGSSDTRRRSA